MSDTSLNISGKLDAGSVSLYQAISEVAEDLGVPFLVVGASARDLVLHYGYGSRIERATADIDVGIEVPSWDAFQVLKDRLLECGFSPTDMEHRLLSPQGVEVDIIPFGPIEDDNAEIAWPPDGDWVMNVLGFSEALEHAQAVQIEEDPPVEIPVATPEGMVLLKLIAWMDRTPDMRDRDAKDLRYLLSTYENIPDVENELHQNQELMEDFDWDLTLAAAYQLGADAQDIAEDPTFEAIAELLEDNHDKLSLETLIEEMSRRDQSDYEKNEALLNAFVDGFLSETDNEAD